MRMLGVSYSGAEGEPTVNSGSSNATSAPGSRSPASSRGSTCSPLSPSRRSVTTTCEAYASTPSSRTPGWASITGTHWVWLVASSGACASAKSSAWSLCTTSSRSPAGSTEYSTPWRRGATTRGTPSGSSAASSRYSEVSLLSDPKTSQRSSRLVPTSSQNRWSGSDRTSASSEADVSSRWRSTTYGRQASSQRV